MTPQQGDVSLFNTPDGGEISIENGVALMNGGLETTVYLSLFGGNSDDTGKADDPRSWWGNQFVTDPAFEYRSETQFFLTGVAAIPANLNLLEKTIERDLAWMFTKKIISNLEIFVSMPAPKRVNMILEIEAFGVIYKFNYTEMWGAQ